MLPVQMMRTKPGLNFESSQEFSSKLRIRHKTEEKRKQSTDFNLNDLPLLFFVQLADRTFILAKGAFFLFIPLGFFEPLA